MIPPPLPPPPPPLPPLPPLPAPLPVPLLTPYERERDEGRDDDDDDDDEEDEDCEAYPLNWFCPFDTIGEGAVTVTIEGGWSSVFSRPIYPLSSSPSPPLSPSLPGG